MSAKKPRQTRWPARFDVITIAIKRATLYTEDEVKYIMEPVNTSAKALREGTGTEWHWKQLASACAISLSIDAKGVVRGLMGHFTHIDNTLATIKARATKTGAWRPTALYFNELDAIKDLVELHEFQIRKLSHAEYIAAAQHAVAEVIRTGGEVIEDAKTMQRSEQQMQRAGKVVCVNEDEYTKNPLTRRLYTLAETTGRNQ